MTVIFLLKIIFLFDGTFGNKIWGKKEQLFYVKIYNDICFKNILENNLFNTIIILGNKKCHFGNKIWGKKEQLFY